MKFTIWKADRQWFWNLRAKNGEIICQSESYRQKAGAVKAINRVRKSANAAIVFVK